MFPTMAAPVYIPPIELEGSLSSPSLPVFIALFSLSMNLPVNTQVVSISCIVQQYCSENGAIKCFARWVMKRVLASLRF